MSLFGKLRTGNAEGIPRQGMAPARDHVATAVAPSPVNAAKAGPGFVPRASRISNGLKEFLSHLDGIGRGQLLDLGSARQTTITFFIERGFKVYSEDLLMTWKIFLDAEEKQLRELPSGVISDRSAPDGSFFSRCCSSSRKYCQVAIKSSV